VLEGEVYGWRETGGRSDINEVIIFFLLLLLVKPKSKDENLINWYGIVKGRNVCFRIAS
jgi:hypothetical protein